MCLNRTVVEDDEQLPDRDVVARADLDLANRGQDLSGHLDLGLSFDGSHHVDRLSDGEQLDGGRLSRCLGRFFLDNAGLDLGSKDVRHPGNRADQQHHADENRQVSFAVGFQP